LPPLPKTTPPHSPLIPLPPHSPSLNVSAPLLQATVEGMTRNLALDDDKEGNDGIKDHSIPAMRGGALAPEPAQGDGL
jgi:hypothetical protein